MASFDDHIKQAKSNLSFLETTNQKANNFLDWQITTCFYIGVHLINSFLAKEADLHFNTHEHVKKAINPHSVFTNTRLEQHTYLAFIKLGNLSRRSRYLCHEHQKNDGSTAFAVEVRHFRKALIELDKVISFIANKYGITFEAIEINCAFTKPPSLTNFNITSTEVFLQEKTPK